MKVELTELAADLDIRQQGKRSQDGSRAFGLSKEKMPFTLRGKTASAANLRKITTF